MRLISGATNAPQTVVTLDEAWRQAESIGRIEVDRDWSTPTYKVEITFESRASRIVARGHHSQILDALLAAIAESHRISRAT